SSSPGGPQNVRRAVEPIAMQQSVPECQAHSEMVNPLDHLASPRNILPGCVLWIATDRDGHGFARQGHTAHRARWATSGTRGLKSALTSDHPNRCAGFTFWKISQDSCRSSE